MAFNFGILKYRWITKCNVLYVYACIWLSNVS